MTGGFFVPHILDTERFFGYGCRSLGVSRRGKSGPLKKTKPGKLPFVPLQIISNPRTGTAEFSRLVGKAAKAGAAFAAAYCVLDPESLYKESAHRVSSLLSGAESNPAVADAIEGIFRFTSSSDNLLDYHEALDGRKRSTLAAAARSQSCLMRAFMSLPVRLTKTLIEADRYSDVDKDLWRRTYIGAIAAARVARSLCLNHISCSSPDISSDVYDKVDLICGPFRGMHPGFTMQIKAVGGASTTFTELDSKPKLSAPNSAKSARVKDSTWHGHNRFNSRFNTSCIPVLVNVGMQDGTMVEIDSGTHTAASVKKFLVRHNLLDRR